MQQWRRETSEKLHICRLGRRFEVRESLEVSIDRSDKLLQLISFQLNLLCKSPVSEVLVRSSSNFRSSFASLFSPAVFVNGSLVHEFCEFIREMAICICVCGTDLMESFFMECCSFVVSFARNQRKYFVSVFEHRTSMEESIRPD